MYLLKAGNQRFFLLPIELSETVGSLLLGHLTFLNPLVAFGSDISIKSCVSRTWFSAQRLMVPPFVNALLIIKRLIVSTKNLVFYRVVKTKLDTFPYLDDTWNGEALSFIRFCISWSDGCPSYAVRTIASITPLLWSVITSEVLSERW